jgi:hypothetical protein
MVAPASGRDLHVDQNLSNVAIGYRADGFIADMIAPIVPVQKQSDRYVIFDRRDVLRVENTKRAPRTEANKVARSVSSATYFAENYALKDSLGLEDRENMDAIYRNQLLNGRTGFITGKLQIDWENRVAAQVMNTSNVGSSAGVGSEWSAGNADVIGDVNTMLDNAHDLTGKRPNRIVLGEDAWRSARRSTDVRNIIFGTNNGGGFASRAAFADLFEVEQILVGGTFKDTANEAQAESLSKIWADHVVGYYAPNAPTMEEPSFMYSFRWNAPGIPSMTAERHPFDPKVKAEEIEVGYYQDEVITGAEYAYMIISVNSST